jgi:hypothetical protein
MPAEPRHADLLFAAERCRRIPRIGLVLVWLGEQCATLARRML